MSRKSTVLDFSPRAGHDEVVASGRYKWRADAVTNLPGWLIGVGAVAAIVAMTSGTANAQTFHDYPCTEDCSGHEAGYNWAEQHDIEDPGDCGGNSNSFIEGCQAYATEHQEGVQEDETDSPDEDDPENSDGDAPDE